MKLEPNKQHQPFTIRFLVVLLISFNFGCDGSKKYLEPPKISLNQNWLFKAGDNLGYRSQQLDDSNWDKLTEQKDWKDHGYSNHVGFAWYRRHITIPSTIKTPEAKDSLKVYLGIIFFCDQVFINGYLLGENNLTKLETDIIDKNFFKKFPGLFCYRSYTIAADDHRINWDKDNIIAIRAFSDLDNRGFVDGGPYLQMKGQADYLKIDKSRFYNIMDQKTVDTVISIRNTNLKRTFYGDLGLIGKDKLNNQKILEIHVGGVALKPNSLYSLPVSIPHTFRQVTVSIDFKEKEEGIYLREEVNLPFVLVK